MSYAGFIYEWTNKLNGMKYLGSHKGKIDDGYVGSGKRFENARKKYGIENFERTIIEYVEEETNILLREQFYLDKFNCARSSLYYNISPNAGGGNCGNGSKISESRKKRFATDLIISNKGKPMSNEQRLKLADEWKIVTPDNKILVITNMLDYCRKNNLNASAMSAVARGKKSNYKGYKCKKLTNKRNIIYDPKEFVFMSKEDRSNQLKSVAIKGGDHHDAVKIKYDGIIYNSISEAKAATGKSYYLIVKYGERL